jgi:release factor glutamine methyltransferase
MAHVLGVPRADVARRRVLREPVTQSQESTYENLVGQRSQRVPLQHLTGVADFAGLRLAVGPGVFVPRPETELLVERALQLLSEVDQPVVVDLCAGSGAIALALAHHAPSATVCAVEMSELAAAWARQNIENLGVAVELRVEAAQHSCSDLVDHVDLVTCNPPYVPPDAEPVEPEVARHDPPMALYGGRFGGLEIPVSMASRAAALLRPGGRLLLEHGHDQAPALTTAIAAQNAWSMVTDHLDLNERPRFLEAVRT